MFSSYLVSRLTVWSARAVLFVLSAVLFLTPVMPALASTGIAREMASTAGLPALPRSLWEGNEEPDRPNFQDSGTPGPGGVQLGTKFTASVDGYVTAVRFYKGISNTGPHVGQLYQADGTLLATKTFTNETATGWQTAYFDTPVRITAGQTYITSYHTTSSFYSYDDNYFISAVVNPPLTALADTGFPNYNAVYKYSATPTFPTEGFGKGNYWVDVVFETPEMPANGTIQVPVGTTVYRRFIQDMNGATFTSTTFEVRDPSNNLIPGTVTYNAATHTAIFTPDSQFTNQVNYTVTIKGGPSGVKTSGGATLPADLVWTFTTEATPADSGSGGPILLVTSTFDGFARFYPEILRTEGFNYFSVNDISTITAGVLAAHDVVILSHMTLSSAQVGMFTTWVNTGGNLIVMRPDDSLASLLGLTPLGGAPLSEGYMLIDTAAAPGAGLVNQTIQYHGEADRYTLNGAAAVATLYSDATTATTYPAVTLRSVGSQGGQVAAFTYDLARSVVLSRQGNPAWSGDERDGIVPITSGDLFYGNKAGDPQPDWLNMDKVEIPQADEQQRLLANLMITMNANRKPMPRFWYFPRDEKAIVVMTSDDHGSGFVDERLGQMMSYDQPGCSVDDWECIRQTVYLDSEDLNVPLSEVLDYIASGHEIALHVNANCSDNTDKVLNNYFTTQVSQFAAIYPGVPAPETERTHCVTWSNYVSNVYVRLNNGIRFDTNYYYYPALWVLDRPGLFTGSGMIMRFADLDGKLIDVYQAPTQLTDQSGQTFPFTINTLLDNALGAKGYYGAFVANMHSDTGLFSQPNIAIVESAIARNVPVVSAKQMLTWLDGRNASTFSNFNWSNEILYFDITAASGARGLRAMLPVQGPNGPLTEIRRNGAQVTYTTQTIKGIQYAFFDGENGSYQASYSLVLVPPALDPIGNPSVNEQSELIFTATATDANNPPEPLTFSLVGAPAGAAINATSGAFTWTPTEAQGPGSYTLDICVSDGVFDDCDTTTVTVNEVNVAPALGAIGSKTVNELVQLTFTATATDADQPANTLTYSLVGAPAGAAINATSGAFTWTPTEAQGPGSYTFTVKVCDNGTPGLCDDEDITVTVNEVNVAPIAIGQTAYASPGIPVDFALSANDPDGDPVTYIIVRNPSHGVLSGTAPNLTYRANDNWPGSDSLQFKVTDGVLESDIATVTLAGPGQSFADVPTSYWAWRHIEAIYAFGITTGCGGGNYCPGATVTRDQMAVFLLRGIKGPGYVLPPVGDSTGFADVPTSHWAAAWIKQFGVEGLTSGCGGGNYCPSNPVTRDQMAVFLLRAKYGALYLPPPVGGSTGFADVPASHWAAAWIKQLAIEGITTGCGGGNFCPGTPVSRDQMAVFLQRTFNLPLP